MSCVFPVCITGRVERICAAETVSSCQPEAYKRRSGVGGFESTEQLLYESRVVGPTKIAICRPSRRLSHTTIGKDFSSFSLLGLLIRLNPTYWVCKSGLLRLIITCLA